MREHSFTRRLLPLALPVFVMACGSGTSTNPVTLGQEAASGSDFDSITTGNSTTRVTGELTGVTYDATNNQIIVDDLPFDGVDGVYTPMGLALLTGYESYESQATAETGQRKYFAVFRRGTGTEVASVGTGDYQDFGFGGATYKRTSASVTLPVGTGEAVYTGKYAGVRILSPNVGGQADVQLVTGDTIIDVDFLDFAATSAVEGRVINRIPYDVLGNQMQVLVPVLDINGNPTTDANGNAILRDRVTLNTIFMGTAKISDDGFITEGNANTVDQQGAQLQSGNYEGVFAGPDGTEIAGVIIIEGKASEVSEDENRSRETGVFIVQD